METHKFEDEWPDYGFTPWFTGNKIFVLRKPTVDEYVVVNRRHDILGQIAFQDEKAYGEMWWFYPVPHNSSTGVFLSSECLKEITHALELLNFKRI